MHFSVLLPVYKGDDATNFARAVDSISLDQTLRPNQVVIVIDGPIPCSIGKVIKDKKELLKSLDIDYFILHLNQNVGLAKALDTGLKYCKFDCVARADADDISVPTRFEEQIQLMDKYDLVGSDIVEFIEDENVTSTLRQMPSGKVQILKAAKIRSPYAHPSVIFKKSLVYKAGGYVNVDKLEDYYLFARMLMLDIETKNISKPLVKYRVGSGAYSRRGGYKMFLSELKLQKEFLKIGFITRKEFVRNVTVRAVYRLIPTFIRKIAYTIMVKTNWSR
ncbi:glycosyltransferase [Actinomyces sp. zg-332]|uniref:glycosyltransferase n=1 Tax=Actinomyces sp. zg-332 TaxID=2708340 RepID=UPI001423F7FE|nr:glycosyltransferase [Actinomyces sp. zg-332]QPK94533.1 glycosyltransferase [Actinomyces sp. zg-332]